MLTNISTPEQLKDESEEIQNFLEITISEEATEAIERGNDLIVYIARTGKMLADAKYHLNEKKKSEVIEMLKRVAKETPNSTSKAVNALVDSICREEQFLVDWIERLNRSCTHQMEWCRTVVSKAKEEMRLAGVGREFNR